MKPVKRVRSSLVPPPVAAVASLVVPGLGQLLAGQIQRGLLVIGSFASIIGLFVWRLAVLAHGTSGLVAQYRRLLGLHPGLMVLLSALTVLLYAWTAFDAARIASKGAKRGFGVFVLIIAEFFVLGWDVSQIDPYRAITKFPDALPPLSKVLWPWEAAITYKTDELTASANILAESTTNPPAEPVRVAGKPYLSSTPTAGYLSTLDANNNIVPGTKLHLTGSGFRPDTETQIWWVDPIGNAFRPREGGQYVTTVTDSSGSFAIDLTMPYRLMPPSAGDERQIHKVEARQIKQVGGPIASEALLVTIERMIETIFLGMMSTLFGIIIAVPVSFLAARNLMSGSWVTMLVYYLTRTVMNIIRSIEPLIWALIAVVWVGLGPFAGVMALTFHSIAALGKLYSEAIESIDPRPIEAIQATGATKLQTIMYAVVPQMIPPFVSFSIYRWDINVRMSTVIGLVGGGGVGFILVQYIRLLDYRAAGIAVWFIALTVAVLDYVSAEIRRRFI